MQGNEILAANALLMQLFTPFQLLLWTALPFLSAEAILRQILRSRPTSGTETGMPAADIDMATLALIFTAGYATLGTALLEILCDDLSTRAAAREYEVWAISIPLAGFMAFVCDGIFYRPHSHAVDAPVHAVRHRRIFHSIYACVADNAQSRPVAGLSMLSGRARTIARTAACQRITRRSSLKLLCDTTEWNKPDQGTHGDSTSVRQRRHIDSQRLDIRQQRQHWAK